MTKSIKDSKKNLVSVLIALILGLQAFTAIVYHPDYVGDAYFPFLDYPMYSGEKYEGDLINRYHVFGVLADGTEVEIKPEDLGLDFWKFNEGFVKKIARDTPDLRNIKQHAALYESLHQGRLASLRVENKPLVLTRAGAKPGRRQVIRTIRAGDWEKIA